VIIDRAVCSACHVVYANDRSPTHSAYYSKYGNQGLSFSGDPSIPKNEKGPSHQTPVSRAAIPTSQCMNCHMHQGNLFVNPFLGYTWWDQEKRTASSCIRRSRRNPTEEETPWRPCAIIPREAATRGLWGDNDFLEKVRGVESEV